MVNAIEVKKLSYNYLQEKDLVLKNISFNVKEGEVYGIIGPSGCGKSTLLLALSGLIPHSIKGEITGTIIVNGKDLLRSNLMELSQNVQILFQSPDSQLFALNVEDARHLGDSFKNNIDYSKVEEYRKRIKNEKS